MTARHGFFLTLLPLWLGCSSAPSASEPACPEQTQQPLVNGAVVESYLGLSERQQRAIVALIDDTDATRVCSGAFIGGSWVLTAAHCNELVKAEAVIAAGEQSPSVVVPVVRRELHPSADIALFQVDFSLSSFEDEEFAREMDEMGPANALAFGVAPLGVPTREFARLAPGVAVELAGYGTTELGDAGALRFLVEQIETITSSEIKVSGFGRSGACDGDSGGPLLIRDEHGLPVVAGVLWGGSYTCRYDDQYVRTDVSAVHTWIRDTLGVEASDAASSRDCGGISAEGRCLYGAALWCDAGELAAELCAGESVCGWRSSASGFRCVSGGAPCAGVDAIGECRDGTSLRCSGGQAQADPCGACSVCRVRGESGIPYCTSGAE